MVQVAPPSRVTCTLPSSVPTQMTSGSIGDWEIEVVEPCVSAPELSGVRPPLSPSTFSGSSLERSGLMIDHVSPLSVVLKT